MQIPTSLRAPVRVATAVAAVIAALNAPAQAQSAPAPATSPSPSPSPAIVTKQHVVSTDAKPSAIGHLPIIDIVPIYTTPGFDLRQSQLRHYDPLDVGGTIQIPLTHNLSFAFDRNVGGTLDQASERILNNGTATYPTVNRDAALTERLDYQVSQFTVEGGLSYRHRIDGASGVSTAAYPYTVSSTEWHYGYLGVTYTTLPIRALFNSRFTFNVTGDYQPVDHHVAVQGPGGVTYIDENPKKNQYYESTQAVGIIVPVNHGLSVTARDSWGATNFYENAPFPYRWDSAILLAVTKKFNNFFSLTIRDQNQHFAPQGAPYAFPNVNHVESVDVLADFHIDTNKLGQFGK